MKTQLSSMLTALLLLIMPIFSFAQAPPLGSAEKFVLFTSVGAMQNVGTYQYLTLLTGDVGTNSGSNTNFGNVNGVMHAGDGISGQCATDLLVAYDFLAEAIPDSTIIDPVLGNNSTIKAGTYLLPGAASLNQTLSLDAQGDPDAVFIFKMPAGPPVYAFDVSANAKIELVNGAQASNVYWFATGAVSIGTETSMKGTIVSGGAISISPGSELEGRALTTNGSVTVTNGDIGLSAYLPVDISASLPTGPAAPVFVEAEDYAVFSSLGDVSDDGTSHVDGSVGGNSALPTGYNPLFVSGNIDGMNPATAGAAADLLLIYNSLNTLTADIELLAPALFGHNLVLTPNTYVMNSAVTFTDTLFLDAKGNPDAVFIIKTYGAFATAVNSEVILKNEAQANNVFWMINGAVSLGDYSVFKGTIVANNGAIDMLSGASLDGRALTTDGAISTTGMIAVLPIPKTSVKPWDNIVCEGDSAGFVVTAVGDGNYTYQWRKGTVNLINEGNISGVTNDTLIVNPVSASDLAENYNVIIYESSVPVDTSANVSISFHPVSSITKDPTNQAVCVLGDAASFSVTAEGAYLTYQWRLGDIDLINAGNISGVSTNTLTVNPVENVDLVTNYNVVVTNICGLQVTSENASLIVNTEILINSHPVSQTVCEGSSASFSADASGAGLTYQWRKGTENLSNTGNISGSSSDVLIIDPVATTDAAANYNVVISGECAPNETSTNASLVVSQIPTAPTINVTQPTCTGATGTVTVTSDLSGLMFSIDGSDYTNTSGIFASVAAGDYELTAQNADGCVSTVADLTMNVQPDTPEAPTVSVIQPTWTEPTGTITVTSDTRGLSFSIDGADYTNTSGIFTSVAPGDYDLTAQNADECVSAGTSVTLDEATSISTYDNKNKAVNIFPNPFAGSVSVVLNDAAQIDGCKLKMFNILGSEVIGTSVTKELTVVDTSNLPSGIYFFQVIDNGVIIQTGKLISQ